MAGWPGRCVARLDRRCATRRAAGRRRARRRRRAPPGRCGPRAARRGRRSRAIASRAGPSRRSPCASAIAPPTTIRCGLNALTKPTHAVGEGATCPVHQLAAGRVAGIVARRRRRGRSSSSSPMLGRTRREERAACRPRPRRAPRARAPCPTRPPRGGRRPPQPQSGPSSSTGTWPSSPAMPSGPWKSRPSGDDRAADAGRDRQVEEVVDAARRRRRPPRRARRRSCRGRGTSAGRAPASTCIGQRDVAEARAEVRRLDDRRPRAGRAGPGAEMPMPTIDVADLGRRAVARGDRRAATHARRSTAAGPSLAGRLGRDAVEA